MHETVSSQEACLGYIDPYLVKTDGNTDGFFARSSQRIDQPHRQQVGLAMLVNNALLNRCYWLQIGQKDNLQHHHHTSGCNRFPHPGVGSALFMLPDQPDCAEPSIDHQLHVGKVVLPEHNCGQVFCPSSPPFLS
jgi:hypothetical protein